MTEQYELKSKSTNGQTSEPISENVASEIQDDMILENLGYDAELKRNFSALELFGIAFGLTGLVPSIASTMNFNLTSGAVGLTWGWLVPGIFITFVGLAMSELASMMPTAGGLYFWAFHLAPKRHRYWLCFLVAYSNILGNLAAAASVNYAAGQLLFSIVTVRSGSSWFPTQAQTFGLVVVFTILQCAICTADTKWLARCQNPMTAFNILLLIGVIIALLVCTPNDEIKGAKYVLGDLKNLNGNWPVGLNFLLAWLSCVWTICSFDTATHISEEAANASTAVPWAITLACSFATVLGFILNCVIAACLPDDLETLLNSPYDMKLVQIFSDRCGQPATIFFIVCMLIIQFDMGLSIMLGVSRTVWAFSRDGGLPFSKTLAKVHKKLDLPLNAIWVSGLLVLIFSVLVLINDVLAAVLFSISTAGLYPAYMIPSVCKLIWGKRYFYRGKWHLGRFSTFVHSVSVIFSSFIIIIFCFPPSPNPSAPTMNYACLVIASILGGCLAYFYFPKWGAKTWFAGPANIAEEIQAVEVTEDDRTKTTITSKEKR